MLNDLGISAPNPLLSNFFHGDETNVFNQSNKTQSHEYEYDDYQQIDGYVDSNFYSDSRVNYNEELKEDMDDNTLSVCPKISLMTVTKFQVLLNDLLIKHKASLLLYDEICHLFEQYISSPTFDRFTKFKSRRSLLTSTQKTFNSKGLRPINGTVRLYNNTLVTVPVFDTKHMIISLLTDPSLMNEKNLAEGYNVFTGKVDNHPANNKYGEVHTGDAWIPARDRYCQNNTDMPIGLIVFGDKSHSDLHGALSLTLIIFTLTLFKCFAHNDLKFWRPIGYIPNVGYGRGTSNKTQTRDKTKMSTLVFHLLLNHSRTSTKEMDSNVLCWDVQCM
jgi:hypothetical protein